MKRSQKFHSTAFIGSLLICFFASGSSADTPVIRVTIEAKADNGDDARLVSALSHEFRKLDGVSVTDTQPILKVTCVLIRDVIQLIPRGSNSRGGSSSISGYACSVAVTSFDGRLISHLVQTDSTIERLAHGIAVALDGTVIEQTRRDAAGRSGSP